VKDVHNVLVIFPAIVTTVNIVGVIALITSLVSSNFSDIGQIVGYQAPVFIQQFPWRLHITITYNLPHLRL
jgi:ABC-type polysaccharide/polyol phosphate export permease